MCLEPYQLHMHIASAWKRVSKNLRLHGVRGDSLQLGPSALWRPVRIVSTMIWSRQRDGVYTHVDEQTDR